MTYQKYYEANKKEILQQKRIYYLENQQQIIDKQKTYYTLNKDQILEYNRKKLLCGCGSVISLGGFKRHLLSMKHQNYLLNIQ